MSILNELAGLITEALVILIGGVIVSVLHKAKGYLSALKKRDELGIIDAITDRAVEYAQAELTGEAGKQKRDFAVARALEILEAKGVKVSEEEVIAGIENGVNKLRMNKQFLTPFQNDSGFFK